MSLRQSGAQKVTDFVNAINGLISSHNSSSTAHSTEMAKKVNINQGTTNNGKFLKVSSGNVTCESVTIPSASSSTPSADVSGGAIGSSSNYAKADHQHPLSSAYATSGHNHSGTYAPVSHTQASSTITDMSTVQVVVTYTDDSTETLNLFKKI